MLRLIDSDKNPAEAVVWPGPPRPLLRTKTSYTGTRDSLPSWTLHVQPTCSPRTRLSRPRPSPTLQSTGGGVSPSPRSPRPLPGACAMATTSYALIPIVARNLRDGYQNLLHHLENTLTETPKQRLSATLTKLTKITPRLKPDSSQVAR